MPSPPAPLANPWRGVFSALCAVLVGIGLARFSYTPLIPALISHGWFAPGQAAYLGAANLAGYLAGALLGRWLASRVPPSLILPGMMALAAVSFAACAAPWPFLWFFAWRVVSGLAGGVLMTLAAPAVLPQVASNRRGLAAGLIFTGVGLGIAASGTLIPLLLQGGLGMAWLSLGALCLALTLAAWGGWPDAPLPPRPAGETPPPPATGFALKALYVEYGLNAVGLVPHMVFLVDFIARGLDRGLAVGAGYWVLFGLGALAGPVASGMAADRIGVARTLRLAYLIQIPAAALPALTSAPLALGLSSVIMGALVPGVVSLVLGRVQGLLPNDPAGQQKAWSIATVAFALGQALAAYGLSYLFDRSGNYALLFFLGSAAIFTALGLDLVVGWLSNARLSQARPS